MIQDAHLTESVLTAKNAIDELENAEERRSRLDAHLTASVLGAKNVTEELENVEGAVLDQEDVRQDRVPMAQSVTGELGDVVR